MTDESNQINDEDNFQFPHPSDPTSDQLYESGLVNSSNWVDYAKDQYLNFEGMAGYLDSTSHITMYLRSLISNSSSKTLEDFKKEIETFCDNRDGFIHHMTQVNDPGKIWF